MENNFCMDPVEVGGEGGVVSGIFHTRYISYAAADLTGGGALAVMGAMKSSINTDEGFGSPAPALT